MSTEVDKNQTIEESAEITHPESLSVWGLAWPSILSNLLFASVGLVAIKAVGSLGAEAVAAVGTGQRIFWVFQALLMAIMAGTTALVARAIGSGNPDEAAQVTRASIGLCLIISFVTAIMLWVGADSIIGLFGLLDDFISLNVTKKLFGQLLASIILVSLGVQVNFFDSPEFFFQMGYPWNGYLNIIFTLLWLIVITNAFNFIDSMDGLAVGLSGLSASFFLLISISTSQLELIFLAVIILGVCIVLYYFNSQPAHLFLGDSGAQLLGFLLACIAIIYQPKVGFQTSTWFVPILLFSVPLFDMFLVIISRLKRGKKIHKASQDHTFHRLSQLGIPMHQAVLMMHGISLILSMVGFLCLNLSEIYANFIFLLVLSLGIITFIKLDKNYS